MIRCQWLYQHFLALQSLRLKVGYKPVDDRLKSAVQDFRQLMKRKPDAVVGNPVLREIVGSDLLAPIAGTHHTLSFRADLRKLLFELHLVQARTENLHCFRAILDLRFLVLAGNHRIRGQMCNPYR